MYINSVVKKGVKMNYAELTKLMKKAGWKFDHNGKGSHIM